MEVLNLNMMKHFLKSILLYERKKMNRAVFENIEDELKQAKNEFVKYHLELVKQETFFLPIEHSIRNILVIKKKS